MTGGEEEPPPPPQAWRRIASRRIGERRKVFACMDRLLCGRI
jgi:hypothetical protein